MLNKIKNSKKGIIEIIVLVFIAVVVLVIFGVDPRGIWSDYALPILQFIWNVFLAILGFVVELGIKLADKLNLGN